MNATLAQGIERAMSAAPDAGAIEFASRWYTWGEMASVMNSLEGLLKETGIDAASAKILVDNGKINVRYVTPEIIASEQKLADTFLEAKQITKRVDFMAPALYD